MPGISTMIVAILAWLVAAPAPPAAPQSPRELLATLMKADNAGDLEAVMAIYADDAVLLPPNEPAVIGKPAIRSRYTRLFANTRMDARFEVDADGVAGALGFVRGRMIGQRVSTDAKRVEDLTGKFVMLLKRDAEGWVISALIWNPDR